MKNIVKIVSEEEYLDWLDKKEGGKLIEKVDTTSGEKTLVLEQGSTKSQYFGKVYWFNQMKPKYDSPEDSLKHIKKLKANDPMLGKTSNMEKLVENKLLVDMYFANIKEVRNASDDGSKAYLAAQEGMNKMRAILKTVRITSNIEESNNKVSEAKALAASFKIEPKSETESTETVSDSTDSAPPVGEGS